MWSPVNLMLYRSLCHVGARIARPCRISHQRRRLRNICGTGKPVPYKIILKYNCFIFLSWYSVYIF